MIRYRFGQHRHVAIFKALHVLVYNSHFRSQRQKFCFLDQDLSISVETCPFPPKKTFPPFSSLSPNRETLYQQVSTETKLYLETDLENVRACQRSDTTRWFTTRHGRLREIYSTHSKPTLFHLIALPFCHPFVSVSMLLLSIKQRKAFKTC